MGPKDKKPKPEPKPVSLPEEDPKLTVTSTKDSNQENDNQPQRISEQKLESRLKLPDEDEKLNSEVHYYHIPPSWLKKRSD